MAAEVFLLRHGETEWNAAGRFQGQLDSALTGQGRDQAAQLGRTLAAALDGRPAPPLHVSPLGRTQGTAAIVARHVPGLGPAHLEPRLAEVTTGPWDGLTHPEIEAGWPGALDGASPFDWYFRAPEGETCAAALGRVRSWLGELNGPVVAVSHGLLGRLIRGGQVVGRDLQDVAPHLGRIMGVVGQCLSIGQQQVLAVAALKREAVA